jgi:hypothetical protein
MFDPLAEQCGALRQVGSPCLETVDSEGRIHQDRKRPDVCATPRATSQ